MGQTREASEELQAQTRDALRILAEKDNEEYFRGVLDLRRALDAAEKDKATLHPLVIGAVATTVEATVDLYERLVAEGSGLAGMLEVILRPGGSHDANDANDANESGSASLLLELAAEIRGKISVDDGLILNTASEALGDIRLMKEENAVALQRQAEEWSRKMHACGAAERAQVVIRRDRRCIPIKAGRNGELPANSVCLGTSGSQSTMYMEPEPIISLNNFNIELTEAEEQEEEAVLKRLSEMVAKRAGLLRRVGAAVVRIDLAFARAKHARWVGGVLPEFCDREVACEDVLHPLLLQSTLEPLSVPRLPVKRTLSSSSGLRGVGGVLGTSALEGIDLVPELWERGNTPDKGMKAGTRKLDNGKDEKDREQQDNVAVPTTMTTITPISILIPEGKRVVVVTGPNTGGKTASLKTFGLLSLMAKAGLAVPTARESPARTKCVWFDKVLVDVGDSQSLQQNLSTFSGHMTRISRILESATPQSLVLLDEVGSGTDPAEGAALAAAILDRLAHGGSAMTYVTTHHAELKESKNPVFLDANVEFDVRTLLPTYKIDWGSSGESHALAVAEGLGFDPTVVNQAREIAKELKEERDEQKRTSDAAAMLKESLPDQIAQVESRIEAASRNLEEHKMMLSVLKRELEDMEKGIGGGERGAPCTTSDVGDVDSVIRDILRGARAGSVSVGDADAMLRALVEDARAGARAAVEEVYSEDEGDNWWVPSAGDMVAVLTMGGAQATVVSVNSKKQTASIRAGMMAIGDVSLADLRRWDDQRLGPNKSVGGKKKSSRFSRTPPSHSSPSYTEQQEQRDVQPVQQQPAIQTTANTVDCRGMTAEEARHEVEAAVGAARAGAVLFVIHGVGTGKVRTSVLESLRKNQRVRKAEQQEGSNGGCAVVYVA